MTTASIVVEPTARRPEPARFATRLGLAYFALLSIPALVDLPGGVSPGQLLMLACLPLWFVTSLNRAGRTFDGTARLATLAILLCSGVLILWSLVGAFHVDVPFRVARPVVSLMTAFALVMLVVGTATRRRLEMYLSILCFALAATGVVTLVAMMEPSLKAVVFQGKDRAFGFFKNPNQFGIAISCVLPVALGMLYGRRDRQVIWLLTVATLGMALLATGSKANILVSAVILPSCLLLFSFVTYSGWQRTAMLMVTAMGCVVAGVIVVLIMSVVNPRALTLIGDVVIEGEATHSLVSRSALWAESLVRLQESPVIGVGAGQPIAGLSHSHNVVLDYARMLGVPGLVFISAKIVVILAVCASSILLAILTTDARLADRYLIIGTALGPIAYIGANFSSDSLGPTTSPFLYSVLFLGLASRSLVVPAEPSR